MATLAWTDSELPLAADDFAALEERVLRTVRLLKAEREARALAEENAATLQQLLDEQGTQLSEAQEQLATLERERDNVRGRVERLLKQLDEIAS
jgi:septal ring factor EnvC (AmiA/AmiB activator)